LSKDGSASIRFSFEISRSEERLGKDIPIGVNTCEFPANHKARTELPVPKSMPIDFKLPPINRPKD